MEREMALPVTIEQTGAILPKFDTLFILCLLMVAVGVGGGIYAQFVGHHHAFANTREMPWGMLIGVYAYLAIISTGLCLMAAISHIFHLRQLLPLTSRMVWLSIIVLLGAFMVIGLEIENPWRMPLNMVLSANLTSNIWWMGTLYGLAVSLLMLEFVLIANRKAGLAVALGMAGALAEVLANTNLGSVFASLSARPFWYGSQLPVFFLASAILSGLAAMILFTHYAHMLRRRSIAAQCFEGIRFAGRLMAVMMFLILLATAWKFANAYSGADELRQVADALVRGPLATNFWLFEIAIGLVLPLLLIVMTRMQSMHAMSLAALMVLVGQFFSRFNLVVAGLIVPQFYGYGDYPLYLAYTPTMVEWSLVIGGFGLVGCGFLAGERVFGALFSAEQ